MKTNTNNTNNTNSVNTVDEKREILNALIADFETGFARSLIHGKKDWEGKISVLEIYNDLCGEIIDIDEFLIDLVCERIEFLTDGGIGKHEISFLELYLADIQLEIALAS